MAIDVFHLPVVVDHKEHRGRHDRVEPWLLTTFMVPAVEVIRPQHVLEQMLLDRLLQGDLNLHGFAPHGEAVVENIRGWGLGTRLVDVVLFDRIRTEVS